MYTLSVDLIIPSDFFRDNCKYNKVNTIDKNLLKKKLDFWHKILTLSSSQQLAKCK